MLNITESYSTVSFENLHEAILNKTNSTVKPSPLPSAVTFTLGVTGNIIAIFFLFKASRQHKWNIFYRLVTALTFTDLFGILTTSPVAFAVYDNDLKWVGGKHLCHYLSFMLTFAGIATVGFVGAMALDRYLAILHPLRYNEWKNKVFINLFIGGIWLISVFVSCLPLIGLGNNVKHFPGTWCYFNFFGETIEDKIFSYFYATIGLGIIVMTAILNILVIIGLSKGRRSHSRRGSSSSKSSRARTDVYITVFLVAIFVTFAVCWAPFMIRIMMNASGTLGIDRKTDLIALRLATLNQILDPWVYILFRREVLAKISAYFRKKRKSSLLTRLASMTSSFKSNSSDIAKPIDNYQLEHRNKQKPSPTHYTVSSNQNGKFTMENTNNKTEARTDMFNNVQTPLLQNICSDKTDKSAEKIPDHKIENKESSNVQNTQTPLLQKEWDSGPDDCDNKHETRQTDSVNNAKITENQSNAADAAVFVLSDDKNE